jgi:DNA-binding XRE family transcriptional regulator
MAGNNDFDALDLELETAGERRARILARSDADLMRDLVELRRARKLTQKALAERMGVTQATVAAFERYDSDPKLSTLRRYAHALEALVKHIVLPDEGQIRDGSEWKIFSVTAPSSVVTSKSPGTYSAANAKRTDFALAS